jgi:hypothetical protein
LSATKEKVWPRVGSAPECCRIQKPQVALLLVIVDSEVERSFHSISTSFVRAAKSGNKVQKYFHFISASQGPRRFSSRYCVSVRRAPADLGIFSLHPSLPPLAGLPAGIGGANLSTDFWSKMRRNFGEVYSHYIFPAFHKGKCTLLALYSSLMTHHSSLFPRWRSTS